MAKPTTASPLGAIKSRVRSPTKGVGWVGERLVESRWRDAEPPAGVEPLEIGVEGLESLWELARAVEFVRWKVRQRNQEAGVETRSLLQRVIS